MYGDLSRLLDFLRNAMGLDIVIVHHDDSDGICSAILLKRFLDPQNRVALVPTEREPRITRPVRDKIDRLSPDVVITCDFAEGLDEEFRRLAKRGVKTIAIDHHVPKEYMFPPDTIYVNPRLEGESMPCSAFVYFILNKIVDYTNWAWIAAIGTIEDSGAEEAPWVIEEARKQYPEFFGNAGINTQELIATKLGLIGRIVGSARSWGGSEGVEIATRALLSCETPREFLDLVTPEARVLKEKFEEYNKEVERAVSRYEKERGKLGEGVYYYEVSSPLWIKTVVANILQRKPDTRLVMVGQRDGDFLDVSLRAPDTSINASALAKMAVEGLENARGGGHPRASGARLLYRDKNVFLERIRKNVERGKKEDMKDILERIGLGTKETEKKEEEDRKEREEKEE